ncbi:MAG: OFA family MFS transporter [Smithellaceae bacterium]
MKQQKDNHGWIVTFAGLGVNLALGILYAWSVIKGGIPDSWGWSNVDKALPYSVACIVFSMAMIPAGWMQDKIGPRWVATLGGVLVGIGFMIASFAGSSLMGFIIGFGILGGAGIGLGYASATPPAVKWFPPQKTGLIAGLVVAGFGLASVYIAPLATYLLKAFSTTTVATLTDGSAQEVVNMGISQTMLVFGISFLIIVVGLAQFMKNPPAGYVPAGGAVKGKGIVKLPVDRSVKEMLGTAQFYILWLIYFAGAGAGLTFISFAQQLGKNALGELAFVAVVVLAIGNAGGRILAGIISDKIGRQRTMLTFLLLQSLAVYVLYLAKGGAAWPLLMGLLLVIGASYGSNLSLFPSATKDYFGLKNFGLNYGFIFTSWGVAGLIMPWVDGKIKDANNGANDMTFFIIIAMLIGAAMLTFVSHSLALRDQKKTG